MKRRLRYISYARSNTQLSDFFFSEGHNFWWWPFFFKTRMRRWSFFYMRKQKNSISSSEANSSVNENKVILCEHRMFQPKCNQINVLAVKIDGCFWSWELCLEQRVLDFFAMALFALTKKLPLHIPWEILHSVAVRKAHRLPNLRVKQLCKLRTLGRVM